MSDDFFQNCTGIRFRPAVARKVVLRFALLNICSRFSFQFIQGQTVDASCRNAGCSAQRDEDGIRIGTLSALVRVVQNVLCVAGADSRSMIGLIPGDVLADPFIDGMGFLVYRLCLSVLDDFICRFLHDSVGQGTASFALSEVRSHFLRIYFSLLQSGQVVRTNDFPSGDVIGKGDRPILRFCVLIPHDIECLVAGGIISDLWLLLCLFCFAVNCGRCYGLIPIRLRNRNPYPGYLSLREFGLVGNGCGHRDRSAQGFQYPNLYRALLGLAHLGCCRNCSDARLYTLHQAGGIYGSNLRIAGRPGYRLACIGRRYRFHLNGAVIAHTDSGLRADHIDLCRNLAANGDADFLCLLSVFCFYISRSGLVRFDGDLLVLLGFLRNDLYDLLFAGNRPFHLLIGFDGNLASDIDRFASRADLQLRCGRDGLGSHSECPQQERESNQQRGHPLLGRDLSLHMHFLSLIKTHRLRKGRAENPQLPLLV